MWYFALYIAFAIWVFTDAKKRLYGGIPWAVSTAILGPLALPVYLAKRPLREGELREGGTAWNVLKNFAIFWTITMFVVGIAGMVGASEAVGTAQGDAEQAGAAIGTALGMGLILVMWFFPMVGALVLGFFMKKSAIIERGPTGALANVPQIGK
jgi:hypothetical protein